MTSIFDLVDFNGFFGLEHNQRVIFEGWILYTICSIGHYYIGPPVFTVHRHPGPCPCGFLAWIALLVSTMLCRPFTIHHNDLMSNVFCVDKSMAMLRLMLMVHQAGGTSQAKTYKWVSVADNNQTQWQTRNLGQIRCITMACEAVKTRCSEHRWGCAGLCVNLRSLWDCVRLAGEVDANNSTGLKLCEVVSSLHITCCMQQIAYILQYLPRCWRWSLPKSRARGFRTRIQKC